MAKNRADIRFVSSGIFSASILFQLLGQRVLLSLRPGPGTHIYRHGHIPRLFCQIDLLFGRHILFGMVGRCSFGFFLGRKFQVFLPLLEPGLTPSLSLIDVSGVPLLVLGVACLFPTRSWIDFFGGSSFEP